MKPIARFAGHVLPRCLLPCVLLAASSPVLAQDWVNEQGISYLCGGVGESSQAEMKSAEGNADAQLVMTAGGDRAYLSDVKLTVASADKQHSASWQASGPICLLKLPAGNFSVDATYGDEHRTAKISRKSGNTPPPLVINFKPS